ncbi:hypothetical protein BMETH_30461771766, partial [methanotrophic bacterial endosymbiont of Bathymodiolus sp.]
ISETLKRLEYGNTPTGVGKTHAYQ